MNTEKYTIFISDTHFNDSQPLMTKLFIDFLKLNISSIEALYLLGDLFETWVGDDDVTETSKKISDILAECSNAGVKVYFIRGNRDFLLGEKFTQNNGTTLLADKTVISLYGKPTLLMHGDLLCTDDRAYQYYRKIMFAPWMKKICVLLPLSLRKAIAQKLRSASQYSQTLKAKPFVDVNQEAVIQALEENHAVVLIHGHVHRAGEYDIPLTHEVAKRMVLGAWEDKKGNAIIASETQGLRVISFSQAQKL